MQNSVYGDLEDLEITHSRGLQQTSIGSIIENFYMLKMQAVISKNESESPYVDSQIHFCYHDLPDQLQEKEIYNLVEK